ncbi:MAG TPA: 4-alpha-glucanotransferase, partial [Verrucomicrobiae bacterium]
MKPAPQTELKELAKLCGVQIGYYSMDCKTKVASPEVLKNVLRCLGVGADSPGMIREALNAEKRAHWARCLEPVAVSWDGKRSRLSLRIPADLEKKAARCEISLEDGSILKIPFKLSGLRINRGSTIAGRTYHLKEINLPAMPYGYHQLRFCVGHCESRMLLISAPTQSYAEPGHRRHWGLFLPLYAAHSERSWGAGNFGDWRRFSDWVSPQGGTIMGTLPLLAASLNKPSCDPSPYSPVSRLFWNEFYIDITAVPELECCLRARKLMEANTFAKRLHTFRAEPLLDYDRQAELRRKVLLLLADCFFSTRSERRKSFEDFLQKRPEVKRYASFRAACDKFQKGWRSWPPRERDGKLRAGDSP